MVLQIFRLLFIYKLPKGDVHLNFDTQHDTFKLVSPVKLFYEVKCNTKCHIGLKWEL